MAKPDNTSAASRVFAIPELVENILKSILVEDQQDGLPNLEKARAKAEEVRALFKLHRVNRTFSETIKNTKALRQAMYLEHVRDATRSRPKVVGINPLLFFFFPTMVQYSPSNSVEDGTVDTYFGIETGWTKSDEEPLLAHVHETVRLEKPGSWRDTTLLDTALKRVYLTVRLSADRRESESYFPIQHELGLPGQGTLGLAIDCIFKVLRRFHDETRGILRAA